MELSNNGFTFGIVNVFENVNGIERAEKSSME